MSGADIELLRQSQRLDAFCRERFAFDASAIPVIGDLLASDRDLIDAIESCQRSLDAVFEDDFQRHQFLYALVIPVPTLVRRQQYIFLYI